MSFLQKIKSVYLPITRGERTSHGLSSLGREGDVVVFPARIAVYDSLTSLPRIVELAAPNEIEFINLLSSRVYHISHEKGGRIPFIVISEVIENLIHASFRGVVVTIMSDGNVIRVSDQGPGIKDKEKVFEPGFSTATCEMRKIIKGVGSGLPIAKEALALEGGKIYIEDNLEEGTVVTLEGAKEAEPERVLKVAPPEEIKLPPVTLNNRQKMVLSLVMELGSAGPSRVAKELNISLSSAYRDLLYLTKKGLLSLDEQGKRSLTKEGISYLNKIFSE